MPSISETNDNVRIRKLEPWIVATHNRLAETEGISLEEHLRSVLKNQALSSQEKFALRMRQRRAEIAEEFGTDFIDSVELIRAVREDSDV